MKSPTCPKCEHKMVLNGLSHSGKKRYRCVKASGGCDYSTTNPDTSVIRDQGGNTVSRNKQPVFARTIGKSTTRFVITAAQNATPAHQGFLGSLKTYCNANNAELLVVPIRYKNPTSRWSASQSNDDVWAPELVPYLWNKRIALNKNIVLLGDVKTQPTASSPLTGFDAMTHGESGILAHTKLQLFTVPVPSGRHPKIMSTTGACTLSNFTDSKAGRLGDFHHTLGASLVEISGKKFHLRQLGGNKRDGSFTDLNMNYSDDGVSRAPRALAFVPGDIHVDNIDPQVESAIFGRGGIVDVVDPEYVAYHDLLDGVAVNPHTASNPFTSVSRYRGGMNIARDEVNRAIAFIEKYTKNRSSVLVPSNHNDFLQRWLIGTDWRSDPANAEFYLETALALVRQSGEAERACAFTYWFKKSFSERKDIIALDRDESFMLSGVELGLHGDAGPNGSRGSRMNLRRIGVKSIVGHSHSPGISEGCWQTGTSTPLRLSYNRGPSSWMQTGCILYASGKRCLINIVDGEWRLR